MYTSVCTYKHMSISVRHVNTYLDTYVPSKCIWAYACTGSHVCMYMGTFT